MERGVRILEMLGIARRSEVQALRSEVAMLEIRNRMLKSGMSSGVEMTFGGFDYESNEKLHGEKRWDVYDKMEMDPHVKEGLLAKILPLMSAEWEIVPSDPDDPQQVEAAELCAANLLRHSSKVFGREYWCQTSWRGQRLAEVCDFLRAG